MSEDRKGDILIYLLLEVHFQTFSIPSMPPGHAKTCHFGIKIAIQKYRHSEKGYQNRMGQFGPLVVGRLYHNGFIVLG